MRQRPLIERKRLLKRIMPKVQSRVRYVGHIQTKGLQFFQLACQHDLEGIVGKWNFGTYRADGTQTSWVKIKNANYSQADGRGELFQKRNGGRHRRHERMELVFR